MTKPHHRLSTTEPLAAGAQLVLKDNAAHYLTTVLRLGAGDAIALFNRTDGEWRAIIDTIRKRDVTLRVVEALRPPSARGLNLIVCFAPIKGGRLETIIEKATELGATVLQPVITRRTIVDKVNLERAELIAREAAEQCERVDWPEIRPPVKLEKLLGDWPENIPLIYGDESGEGTSVTQRVITALCRDPAATLAQDSPPDPGVASQTGITAWGVLAGPEGGFAPEEFALLKHLKPAMGVGLGPRILRADTAIITLCVATLMVWGDWDQPPRFTGND